MKGVIIGAGRGRRLGGMTELIPKTLVEVLRRPMLEHVLEALAAGGLTREQVVFIRGYKGDVIEARYPELSYVRNDDWQNNNILLSLLCAREHLTDGFVSSYSDIVYLPEAVEKVLASPHDITLVCDTDWRRRYVGRSEHPETDAEKLRAHTGGPERDRVLALSRRIPSEEATGEFIGVMRMTAKGAGRFFAAFDQARSEHADDDPFVDGRSFAKAYLIDLLERMIAAGEPVHCVRMHGGYMEIDTIEDAQLAERWWGG